MAILPEPQSQIITSPDNKIQIFNHRTSREGFGAFCVEGAIRNLTSEPNLKAQIRVEYFDSDNNKIDSETDIINNLRPGFPRGFYISFAGKKRNSIQYYRLYLTTFMDAVK